LRLHLLLLLLLPLDLFRIHLPAMAMAGIKTAENQ